MHRVSDNKSPYHQHVHLLRGAELYPDEKMKCASFYRHKGIWIKPSVLAARGIPYDTVRGDIEYIELAVNNYTLVMSTAFELAVNLYAT